VEAGPAQNREAIGVGDGEALTHKIRLPLETPIEISETTLQMANGQLACLVGHRPIPQRVESFVKLRACKIQPFLDPVSLQGSQPRHKMRRWDLIGHILENNGNLGQDITAMKGKRGNIAFGIDPYKITSRGCGQGFEVYLVVLDLQACFTRDNPRCKRAGSRGIVQLHYSPSSPAPWEYKIIT
jgi:hypothetical protein